MSREPTHIDHYELRGELARGGMGVVYRAFDPRAGREVAIKLLLALVDPADRARFRREAEVAARVVHPNVVRVHTYGAVDGQPYLVLDLVPGQSLRERVRAGGPLAPREAARIVERLAGALEAAHQVGVLHRDIKPANVLLTPEGEPLLTDFGIAKRLDGTSRGLTQTGETLGTPSYMAPEQARGLRGGVDERTDVYGLGATLFDLLCGHPPFEGDMMTVLTCVMTKAPPQPSSLNAEVDPDLQAICLRCLSKDPAERYPSVQALGNDLRRYLHGRPVEARPLDRGELIRRTLRDNPVLALTLVLGAAVLGLAAGMLLTQGEDRAPEPPPTPPARATPPPPATSPERVPMRELLASRELLDTELHIQDGSARVAERRHIERYTAGLEQMPPGSPGAVRQLRNRARSHLRLGELEDARRDLDEAVGIGTGDPWVHGYRAILLGRLGELGAGEEAMARAFELAAAAGTLDKPIERLYRHRAMLREARGELDAALADYGRAIEFAPASAEAWGRRGCLRAALGRPLRALSDLRQFGALADRALAGARALRNLAGRLASSSPSVPPSAGFSPAADPVFAGSDVDPAELAAWPDELPRPDPRQLLRAREFARSLTSLSELLARAPRQVSAWVWRGLARHDLGDLPGALADLDQGVQLHLAAEGSSGEPHHLRGYLRLVRSRSDPTFLRPAVADLTWVVEHDEAMKPQAYLLRGFAHRALEDAKWIEHDFRAAEECARFQADLEHVRKAASAFRPHESAGSAIGHIHFALRVRPQMLGVHWLRLRLKELAGGD